jgi:hypothetical protein
MHDEWQSGERHYLSEGGPWFDSNQPAILAAIVAIDSGE